MKYNFKNKQVPGYSKKLNDGSWEYSEKSLSVLLTYKEQYH